MATLLLSQIAQTSILVHTIQSQRVLMYVYMSICNTTIYANNEFLKTQ